VRATRYFILLSIFAGCGPSTPQTVAVRGVVKTTSGNPCDGALVVFHPQANDRLNDPKPVATTDGSGNFSLTTFASEDGAVPGDYGVTIVWPGKSEQRGLSLSGEGDDGGADQLGNRYGDPRTPLIQVSIPTAGKSDLVLEVEG
jgi:hypothetical protein